MLGSLEAFFIHLGGGLTFEFGDDLYCYARQEGFGSLRACQAKAVTYVTHLGEAHPYAAFAGTLIGYAISPLSGLLAAIVGRPKSAGEAFGRGLVLELIEGALSVLGQVITGLALGPAMWSLGLSAVIAPVRGAVAAVTYSWIHSGVFRFLVVIGVLGALAVLLNRVGALPV
ncbi:MAG: hypothetical protein AAFR17_17005 [Pseudomonadota bacterium]